MIRFPQFEGEYFKGTKELQRRKKFSRLAKQMRVSHLFLRLLLQNAVTLDVSPGRSVYFHLVLKNFYAHYELSFKRDNFKFKRGQKELKILKHNFPSSFFTTFNNYKYKGDENI